MAAGGGGEHVAGVADPWRAFVQRVIYGSEGLSRSEREGNSLVAEGGDYDGDRGVHGPGRSGGGGHVVWGGLRKLM